MTRTLSLILSLVLGIALCPAEGAKPKKAEAKSQAAAVAHRDAAKRQHIAAQQKLSAQRNAASNRAFTAQRQLAAQQSRLSAIAEQRRAADRFDTRRDARRFDFDTRSRTDVRHYSAPPYSSHRSWDRARIHWWNERPYRWYGGSWVLFDTPSPDEAVYSLGGASAGTTVGDVQAALSDAGYEPGPMDGVLGAQTRAAIADYEADHGLDVTGRINGALLRSLGL